MTYAGPIAFSDIDLEKRSMSEASPNTGRTL
jgi:hypothetical protein